MKKYFNLMLMAALVCGLSLGVTSCKDDEKEPSEEEQEQAAQTSEKFWSVVGQLISYTDIVDDYEGKTFETNVGEPADNDPLTRIVATNTMEAAVRRYNNLTGANITATTATHTFSDPEVGTLTWTKTTDGTSWATVDVNIKQLPGLQKIVYQSFEQGNDNGKFDGRAYYRFGDVIKRSTGTASEPEYWICVRPAFGKEGKEKSHWVNIGVLQNANIYPLSGWKKNPGVSFWLPTKLGEDKVHMQNFAEMLYAISHPTDWEKNLTSFYTEDQEMFEDFEVANIRYHNQFFWQNVQNAWVRKGIITNILNLSGLDELQKIEQNGVHLLYKGYSWPINYAHLWEAVYTNGTDSYKNMHKATYTEKPEVDMRTIQGNIDFRQGGSKYLNNYKEFFGDNQYRWVIRHATGKELSSTGKFEVRQPIPGTKVVYRYYEDVLDTDDLMAEPEVTGDRGYDKAKVNQFIGKDGNLYNSKDAARTAGTEAVALVVYVGKDADTSNDKEYHGLAVALEYADDGNHVKWCSDAENTLFFQETKDKEQATWPTQLDGIKRTTHIAVSNNNCRAADLARNYDVEDFDPEDYDMSDWFLPSVGQVLKCLTTSPWNIPITYKTNSDYIVTITSDNMTSILGRWRGAMDQSTWAFWTSTEYTKDEAVYVNFDFTGKNYIHKLLKSQTHPVLPFIAF